MNKHYQLFARNSAGVTATYAECKGDDAALQRCAEEFPETEGWHGHYAVNLDTGEVVL